MRSHWSKVSFQTHEVIVSTMLWGFVIVIKRNGTDGSTFPMVNEVKREGAKKVLCEKWFSQECLLGRGEGCDIRIQLPVVSKEHARIKVQAVDQKVLLYNYYSFQNSLPQNASINCNKFVHRSTSLLYPRPMPPSSMTMSWKMRWFVKEASALTPKKNTLTSFYRFRTFFITVTCSQSGTAISAGSSPKVLNLLLLNWKETNCTTQTTNYYCSLSPLCQCCRARPSRGVYGHFASSLCALIPV